MGYQVNGLNKYLARKSLINKNEADKYMKKLLKEKASISWGYVPKGAIYLILIK